MHKFKNQQGQVVIILLLVMVVTLGIGLSIIGRSTTEISTSTKTENSSRAFSAAEAGLEKAFVQPTLAAGTPMPTVAVSGLNNQASANVNIQRVPDANIPGLALQYSDSIDKNKFAQFWFANPQQTSVAYYKPGNFEIYFGDPSPQGNSKYYDTNQDEKPAIKVNIIYWDIDKTPAAGYSNKAFLIDTNSARLPTNGFLNCADAGALCSTNLTTIDTNRSGNSQTFYRKYTVDVLGAIPPIGSYLIMARVRILYSSIAHPVAIKPICPGQPDNDCSLPLQARQYDSVGTSGNIQRRLRVYQPDSVMPWLFDYALFSAGSLDK